MSAGLMIGMGNAFVALGFNEPLTISQRFYGLEQLAEEKMINFLEWIRGRKVCVRSIIQIFT